jgi:hypothetical protein
MDATGAAEKHIYGHQFKRTRDNRSAEREKSPWKVHNSLAALAEQEKIVLIQEPHVRPVDRIAFRQELALERRRSERVERRQRRQFVFNFIRFGGPVSKFTDVWIYTYMDNIDLILERNFGIWCGSEIGGYGSESVRATD